MTQQERTGTARSEWESTAPVRLNYGQKKKDPPQKGEPNKEAGGEPKPPGGAETTEGDLLSPDLAGTA